MLPSPVLPAEPNPILELHERQSFLLSLMMPILVIAESYVPVGETTLGRIHAQVISM